MSYKDGIPLLASFEDDVDEDDLTFENLRPRGKCRCSKRSLMFSVVLGLAIALVIALIVGVTVPVVLLSTPKPSSANTGSGINQINKTSETMIASDTITVAISQTSFAITTTVQSSQMQTKSTNFESTTKRQLAMSSLTQTVSASLTIAPTAATSSHRSTVVPRPTPSTGQRSSVVTTVTSMSSAIVSSSSFVRATTSVGMVSVNSSSAFVSPTTSHTYASSVLMPTPSMTPPPFSDENCTDDQVVCLSKLDNRSYQVTTLKNGLRVLLISDPNSNISAAAMDIPAGSFNDPKEYEGLAHFCEHMLFIGTGKYPNLNQYSNYLQTHGGSDNAYTSTQNTNYFFNIQADYFSQALDMFAHFFIDPLFSVGSVMDEMNAVNAEHQKNLQNDGWKLWQLLKNVSNPAHPFSQFNTGSLETLNKSDVHEQLWHYYNTSYSANTMQLVVYGRDDLDTLLATVHRSFEAIPNRLLTKTNYSGITSFPPPNYSGYIIHYYPVADKDTLTLYWQLTPSLEPFYRHAVGSFVTQYLGHEGTTSAAYRLKVLNYITSLSAYTEFQTDTYTLFTVQIELTDNGVENVGEVIQILYQHVVRFKSINESEFNRLWNDFVPVSQIRFDYSERATPIDYVSAVASTMRTVRDPADFLKNPRRYEACYNLTSSTLNQLTPNNSLVFLGTHKITFSQDVAQQLNFTSSGSPPPANNGTSEGVQFPWPELDTIEPIYLTPFHRDKIPDDLLSYWSNAVNHSVQLPERNAFIPSDFTIINEPSNSSSQPTRLSNADNNAVSMWKLLDTRDFPQPRVNIECMLNNTNATISAAWEARSRLFAKFIETILQPALYDATLVGYKYSVESYTHGLKLSFRGLSDKMSTVISGVVSQFLHDALLQQAPLFNTAKADLIDQLENFNFTGLAFRYTFQYLQPVVMERPYWTNEEVLAELVKLNITQVVDFGINELLQGSGTSLLCLAHGNVNDVQAQLYAQVISGSRFGVGLLRNKPFSDPFGHYWQHRVKLTDPGNYSVVIPTLNPEDRNSVVNVIFQVGEMCEGASCSRESLLRYLHLSLLTQMLNDECFTYLRTTNKLGYVAYCLGRSNENVGSFQVLVQSEAFDGGYVLEKITDFLEDYVLNSVFSQENNFTQFVAEQRGVLKSVLLRKDATLYDRTTRLWNYIQHGQLTFDLRQQQIDLLDSGLVNATSVKEFYMEHVINSDTYRKMIMVVNGKDRAFEPDATNRLDYTDLPNCLTYPTCSDAPA